MSSVPPNNEWPAVDLESVPRCPVCGSGIRGFLYDGLTDRVFGTAPGQWRLQRCEGCGSVYLDPQPTPQSIGRAYAAYNAHAAEDHPIMRRKGRVRTLLYDWINGYRNTRYGSQRALARSVGRWLLPLLPSLRTDADAECRHLPLLPADDGRLLDVGCGNGGFLTLAQQAGWTVKGVDFDPDAVRTVCGRSLDVRQGGIEVFDHEEACFDVITVSHVIEHMYHPVQAAQRVHALLKPGGLIWLDTPNFESLGARHLGADWRGLEAPRHLVLFSPTSLRKLLRTAGFRSIRQCWRGMTVFNEYAESEAMRSQGSARGARSEGKPPVRHIGARVREMLQPARRECLTLLAYR